jgi:hypothetical protein
MADRGPLPGVAYPGGTMAIADLYPTHVGIGGVTTQDRALPAFAEATEAAAGRAGSLANPEGLLGTPAGYLALILAGLVVAAWLYH